MRSDDIQIDILADGTIKVTTDPIGAANHQNAEQFLKEMGRLAGGETTRTRRHGKEHSHDHAHGHGQHTHQH